MKKTMILVGSLVLVFILILGIVLCTVAVKNRNNDVVDDYYEYVNNSGESVEPSEDEAERLDAVRDLAVNSYNSEVLSINEIARIGEFHQYSVSYEDGTTGIINDNNGDLSFVIEDTYEDGLGLEEVE